MKIRDPRINRERDEKVIAVVRQFLDERFTADEFVFNPIVVIPTYDEWGPHATGELYLRILIIYDGDQKNLDVRWTGELIGQVREELLDQDIEEWPNFSWIPKSEWPWLEKRERRHTVAMVYESA